MNTVIENNTDNTYIRELLYQAPTDKINDRVIFMKGIGYSYYYGEGENEVVKE